MHRITHSFIAGSMGGLSINLAHLPFPGTVLEQPGKLMVAFEIITSEMYADVRRKMERK